MTPKSVIVTSTQPVAKKKTQKQTAYRAHFSQFIYTYSLNWQWIYRPSILKVENKIFILFLISFVEGSFNYQEIKTIGYFSNVHIKIKNLLQHSILQKPEINYLRGISHKFTLKLYDFLFCVACPFLEWTLYGYHIQPHTPGYRRRGRQEAIV